MEKVEAIPMKDKFKIYISEVNDIFEVAKWDFEKDDIHIKVDDDVIIKLKKSLDFKILRYIGLKDKYDKEIFEGDIIKTLDGKKVVKYKKYTARYIVADVYGKEADFEDILIMKVIGNIYKDKDLFKED